VVSSSFFTSFAITANAGTDTGTDTGAAGAPAPLSSFGKGSGDGSATGSIGAEGVNSLGASRRVRSATLRVPPDEVNNSTGEGEGLSCAQVHIAILRPL
jgi:hypothetical protein